MTLQRTSLLMVIVIAASACGGGVTGVPAPTPVPTPPPGGLGSVTGIAVVAPTAMAGRPAAAPPSPSGALLRPPPSLPTYVPDRLLVKLRTGVQASQAQALHQQASGTIVRVIPHLDVQIIQLASGARADAALATYRGSPVVEYAEQDVYGYLTATPNDQLFNLQWHYSVINLPAAWDTTRGSPATIVAVLDSGIRSHPDLDGVTVQGFDFFGNDPDPTDPGCSDPSVYSHGVHVAGTVAALTNNSIGVAGVNWGGAAGTKIMPIRVGGEISGNCGAVLISGVADGIMYATDHGAKVINMSLGSTVGMVTLQNAVNYAVARGVTLVAAAGNDFGGPVRFPAAYANVIAVAATACNNARASYSNMGPELDVAAPGGDNPDCDGDGFQDWVLSTGWRPSSGNTYQYNLGTSMAAPHVAGVVALMISRGTLGPAAIQSRLESTAIDLGPAGKDSQFGSGLVNAAAAVGGGSGAGRVCVLSGVLGGSTITRQSDMVRAADAGTFSITNAQSGIKSVFVWQDFDASGTVTPGDAYGQVDNVAIWPGGTTSGVSVTVQTRVAGSPTLSVTGGAACP